MVDISNGTISSKYSVNLINQKILNSPDVSTYIEISEENLHLLYLVHKNPDCTYTLSLGYERVLHNVTSKAVAKMIVAMIDILSTEINHPYHL